MMGASKRIMEMYLMKYSKEITISTARFANVAFSDGSLLHGFNQRINKKQPIVAPNDVKRYFVTPNESGELCLMSCIFGENRDIYFPKLSEQLHSMTFADIAVRYLKAMDIQPMECSTEEEARMAIAMMEKDGKWPCLFTKSDTTGEKDFEEFFTERELLDMNRFENLGIIKNSDNVEVDKINHFSESISAMKQNKNWTKEQLVTLFCDLLPDFQHKETGKYLDGKM
jgi:FlaA1/EpsC-like NDP-sugar epimerase